MDVLVLAGDYWHPAEVVRTGLKNLLQFGFHFDVIEDAKDILTPERLRDYPVIMNCKCNDLTCGNEHPWFEEGVTEVMPKEFRAYVEDGGGFLSVHSGNAFMAEDNGDYRSLIGATFVTHPPRCRVEVRITGKHPITDGVENFIIRDEHYQMDLLTEDVTELFRTVSERGGNRIGGWTREIGSGRLAVLTPGHILSVWEEPQYIRLLAQALRWAAGSGSGIS